MKKSVSRSRPGRGLILVTLANAVVAVGIVYNIAAGGDDANGRSRGAVLLSSSAPSKSNIARHGRPEGAVSLGSDPPSLAAPADSRRARGFLRSSLRDSVEMTRLRRAGTGAGQTSVETAREADRRPWRRVRMRVTAYCPCEKCCGRFADGVTASGHRIEAGDRFVAADSSLAFGTEVVVPGYNGGRPVPVLDRGGAIKGRRLDVFFPTHEEALRWGVQDLEVTLREAAE